VSTHIHPYPEITILYSRRLLLIHKFVMTYKYHNFDFLGIFILQQTYQAVTHTSKNTNTYTVGYLHIMTTTSSKDTIFHNPSHTFNLTVSLLFHADICSKLKKQYIHLLMLKLFVSHYHVSDRLQLTNMSGKFKFPASLLCTTYY